MLIRLVNNRQIRFERPKCEWYKEMKMKNAVKAITAVY